MPDVDLAAIRADWSRLCGLLDEIADALANGEWAVAAEAARWADGLVDAKQVDVPGLLTELGRRNAEIRVLRSERDGLIRDRDCYRSAWRTKSGLPPLPGFEVSPLDPVPPTVVGVLDETHVWTPAVRLPEPRNPTPATTD